MLFYVIMPVGADEQFAAKRSILEKIAQRESLIPYFPFDRSNNIAFDIDRTLSVLKDSAFVLADLSMERPSCYFELGLAQALGKDVYIIAGRGTDIHQAHGRTQTLFYDSLSSYEEVTSNILKAAKTVKPLVRLRA